MRAALCICTERVRSGSPPPQEAAFQRTQAPALPVPWLSSPGLFFCAERGLTLSRLWRLRHDAAVLAFIVRASTDSVGPELCQRRLAHTGSFGHRFKKLRLPHRLVLSGLVDFPSPGFGWTPFVSYSEGVVGHRRHLDIHITITFGSEDTACDQSDLAVFQMDRRRRQSRSSAPLRILLCRFSV